MKRHGEWVVRTLVAAVVVGTGVLAAAQGQSAAVDALVSKYAQLGQFNGTVLVAREGKVVLEKGYGMANFENSVPNRAETRQWIGSVTKIFTATAVMKLADGGKLGLEDRVADLLPWYRKDTGAKVTVRELLNHTSGIPDYMHLPGIGREGFRKEAGESVIDVKAFVQRWCSGDLAWEPGTRWGYSNSGYVLLGAIIEQVTGRTYDQVLQELVLGPAGLEATADLAMRPRAVVDGLASGYEKVGGTLVTRRAWNVSTAYAAGAMVSTVGDLYRLDRALDQPGFLSPQAKEAMFTAGLGNWGCGWEVRTLPVGPGGAERKVAGHEGFIFWTLARICRIPQDRIFIALVNNTGDAPLQPLLEGITDILYGRPPKLPVPSVGDALRAAIAAGGPAAAAPKFRDLRAKDPAGWDFGERALNALGYEYLQGGQTSEAVAVFRLNAEVNPRSGNAWDSLGEGLAAQGEREEAVKAYAHALELDPGNRNAVQMLQKITAD